VQRLYIAPDEWWPVATLSRDVYRDDYAVDFTADEVADLLRLESEFNKWQAEIARRIGIEPTTFKIVNMDGDTT